METIIYNVWGVIDSIVQIGIYLAIVKGLARIVVSLRNIARVLEDIGSIERNK